MARPKGTRFGVRLFTFTPVRGDRRSPQGSAPQTYSLYSESIRGNSHALEDILATLTHAQGSTYWGDLKLRGHDDQERHDSNTPGIRIVNVDQKSNRVDVTFQWGRLGSHDKAMREDGNDDIDLEKAAPSNEHFATLYFPKGDGSAVLCAEARSRLCLGPDLAKYISVLMKADHDSQDGPDGWWKFHLRPMSDDEQMERTIENGHAKGVTLKEYHAGQTGRRSIKRSYRENGLPEKTAEAAKDLVKYWTHRGGQRKASDSSGQQLAGLLDDVVDGFDWDTGGVIYELPEGGTHTFTPENILDAFTYEVTRGKRPPHAESLCVAEERLRSLMSRFKLELDL